MSLGGVEAFHRVFSPLFFEVHRAPDPDPETGFEGVFAWMLARLEEDADRIAGIVVEPLVQGAAGMRFYDAAHLRALRAAADRHDTFLILDEVFTGFGRTGTFWAAERAGIAPDLLCTAKGLSSIGDLTPARSALHPGLSDANLTRPGSTYFAERAKCQIARPGGYRFMLPKLYRWVAVHPGPP